VFSLTTASTTCHYCVQPYYYINHLPLLCSALLLHQPPATTLFSSRAFPIVAPTVWNSLHINTCSAETHLTSEIEQIKTELFQPLISVIHRCAPHLLAIDIGALQILYCSVLSVKPINPL